MTDDSSEIERPALPQPRTTEQNNELQELKSLPTRWHTSDLQCCSGVKGMSQKSYHEIYSTSPHFLWRQRAHCYCCWLWWNVELIGTQVLNHLHNTDLQFTHFSLFFQLIKHSLTSACLLSSVIRSLQLLIFNRTIFRDSILSNSGLCPPIHQHCKWPPELARMSNQNPLANQASQKTFNEKTP